jgi:hypothetical protein
MPLRIPQAPAAVEREIAAIAAEQGAMLIIALFCAEAAAKWIAAASASAFG